MDTYVGVLFLGNSPGARPTALGVNLELTRMGHRIRRGSVLRLRIRFLLDTNIPIPLQDSLVVHRQAV